MAEITDPWTDSWEEAVASVPKNVVQLETLELQHPAFGGDSIRAVNDVVNHFFTLEPSAPMFPGESKEFARVPFGFTFPDYGEGKGPEATVRIDNLGDELQQYLDEMEGMFAPVRVIYRVYLSTDPTTVAMGPFTFYMRGTTESNSAIEGKVSLAAIQNLKFLTKVYSNQEYPSLMAVS